MKNNITLFLVAIAATFSHLAIAANGDTTHVITHNQVLIQTDPSIGETKYKAWGVFPDANKQYRKVILTMSYKCPDGLHCGEWDYINYVYIRRKGGVAGDSSNIEMARFITPYGWNFNNIWKFSWDLDVTDYALLLHDSLEIEYKHTGYEAKADRGWLVTLDFTLIEGTPAMVPVKIEDAWQGSRGYGSTTNPIDNYLQPKAVVVDPNAALVRLRIIQTGHGNEPTEGCSEFCDKYRDVLLDNTFVKRDHLWKVCGDNPVYPQAGTWVYSRGNWCPGSVVIPNVYDFPLAAGSAHNIDLDMEPFTASDQTKLGTFTYSSQFIHYKAPTISNDASIETIISPSTADLYSRLNADCANPVVQVKNNGKNDITSLTFAYGFLQSGTQTYTWTGKIIPQETTTIHLPGYAVPGAGDTTFKLTIIKTNGQADGYTLDNSSISYSRIPATYPGSFFVMYRPNKRMEENSYTVTDSKGKVWYQKDWTALTAGTIYRDTFTLPTGCYNFTLTDAGNDGIDFWANKSDVGSGLIRLLNVDGSLLNNMNPDFGSFNTVKFMVGTKVGVSEQSRSNADYVKVYPNPSKGEITLDIALGNISNAQITVTDILGNTVYTYQYEQLGNDIHSIHLTDQSNGIYFVNVKTQNQTYTRKVMLFK